MQVAPHDARLAIALAGCSVLAVTLPVLGARGVPSIVRACFAIVLAPIAVSHVPPPALSSEFDVALDGLAAVLTGATLGISAAILAGAAASAGALFDAAIAAAPIGIERITNQTAGPFALLLPLGFAVSAFSSGAFTWLTSSSIVAIGQASALSHLGDWPLALGRLLYGWVVGLAFPLLCACALSSLVAAAAARAAPKINGMLLAPAMSSALALMIALAAVPATFAALNRLAELAARIAHAT